MGYRSDVALAMKEERFKELIKTMDDKTAAEFVSGADFKEREEWVLVYFSDVKWYDDYPEVKAVNNFISDLDEEDYSYHILGEDQDDYIQRGTYDNPFEIRLTRSLDYNW